jgi:nucleoid DNA-binding protein
MINNHQFIREVAKDLPFTQNEVKVILKKMQAVVEEHLKAGEDVKLNNFITFKIRQRKETHTVNPLTKQPAVIPPTKSIRVYLSKPFKKHSLNKE